MSLHEPCRDENSYLVTLLKIKHFLYTIRSTDLKIFSNFILQFININGLYLIDSFLCNLRIFNKILE